MKSTLDPTGATHPIFKQDYALGTMSDAELESVIRERLDTLFHPTSTARMAPLEDGGVVDTYLRVRGVENLRIVDASIFPTIPSGHTVSHFQHLSANCFMRIAFRMDLSSL